MVRSIVSVSLASQKRIFPSLCGVSLNNSNDTDNSRMANTIVVYITSNTSRSGEPTQILIDVSTPDGRQSGLKQTSVVSCENILTFVQADILRTIGHLPDTLMQRVDRAPKVSLALS
jgi:mRNA interferase MazF